MGISGLLPLLKPIHQQKHLSEFAGQTIAVDAYVWLHKGVYACATELAMGKKTTKYVDYAMHRVRLLRHHGIQPYIVFDGGPLPAKAPTEVSRKQRREEALAKGQELARKGRWGEAREHFVKSVDVSTEMAYQLIKALRAENVPYVVAPYEADAQLTYLERLGLADAILTEDSDLLVFGCKTALFKLDAVTATVTCITSASFASMSGGGDGISLSSFTPKAFREMCMLSGCDYLASIPGVGLKTACALLRKWRTVERAVRAVKMEGKKAVPKGYEHAFRVAEKAFIYQRVYDPLEERLVCLTDVSEGEEWDEEVDKYVGGDLDPELASKIARGDVCPITMLPIRDINPDFMPRSRLATVDTNSPRKLPSVSEKGKGKAKAGILSFFNTKPKESPISPSLSKAAQKARVASPTETRRMGVPTMVVGRASGKRTLVEVMEADIEERKKRRTSAVVDRETTHSRFFGGGGVEAGPSRPREVEKEKENVEIIEIDEEEEIVEDVFVDEDASLLAEPPNEEEVAVGEEEWEEEGVEQEDGYISPSPTMRRGADTPDLSSPVKPQEGKRYAGEDVDGEEDEEDGFDGADVLSSPTAARTQLRSFAFIPRVPSTSSRRLFGDRGGGKGVQAKVLVETTPEREEGHQPKEQDGDLEDGEDGEDAIGDLRHAFGDDLGNDGVIETDPEDDEGEEARKRINREARLLPFDSSFSSASTRSDSAGPETPQDGWRLQSAPVRVVVRGGEEDVEGDEIGDEEEVDWEAREERDKRERKARQAVVADGWRDRWACKTAGGGGDGGRKTTKVGSGGLRRHEMTVRGSTGHERSAARRVVGRDQVTSGHADANGGKLVDGSPRPGPGPKPMLGSTRPLTGANGRRNGLA